MRLRDILLVWMCRFMSADIVYEVDVADLKRADRARRIVRAVVLSSLYFIFIFALVLVIGMLALPVFLFALFAFLPAPLVPTPSRYKITSRDILFDKYKKFPLRRGYTPRLNEERKFVSIHHRWRGELIRLYTPEPKKVASTLSGIILKLER